MKSMRTMFTMCAATVLLLSSCAKKEEKPDVTSYAKVLVNVADLPGTPALEVRYQEQNIGDAPIRLPGIFVEASSHTKIAIYVKGTNELVADSVLNLKKGELAAFRVAYSKDLGISGWLNSKPVAPDSISFQLLNNLGDFNKMYPAYDLYLYYYDSANTGEFLPEGLIIQDFQKVKLDSHVTTVPFSFPSDPTTGIFYVCKLKDKATGQFINFSTSGSDFFTLPPMEKGGHNLIYNINFSTGDVEALAVEL